MTVETPISKLDKNDRMARLKEIVQSVREADGFKRWLEARGALHHYSFHNQILIATQCHQRGIAPRMIAGAGTWKTKFNRIVKKGETALWIWRPNPVKIEEEQENGEAKRIMRFKPAPVFDVSQTRPIDGLDVIPLAPPRPEPIAGNTHEWAIKPLVALAEGLGYTVHFREPHPGSAGHCDYANQEIWVDEKASPNLQLRILIHEVAHAMGAGHKSGLASRHAEQVADAVAYTVCHAIALEATECPTYIAVHGDADELEQYGQMIDDIASEIEGAIDPPDLGDG